MNCKRFLSNILNQSELLCLHTVKQMIKQFYLTHRCYLNRHYQYESYWVL